jgi:hypothetical protein
MLLMNQLRSKLKLISDIPNWNTNPLPICHPYSRLLTEREGEGWRHWYWVVTVRPCVGASRSIGWRHPGKAQVMGQHPKDGPKRPAMRLDEWLSAGGRGVQLFTSFSCAEIRLLGTKEHNLISSWFSGWILNWVTCWKPYSLEILKV